MKVSANLNRQVFNKQKFGETVDTNFNQLVEQTDPTFFDVDLATQEDFFILYDKFFFEIPKQGQTNSHEYLIRESSNYVGFEETNEEIQALLEEIAQLRQENLELREQQVSNISNSIGSATSGIPSSGNSIGG